jgi:hypothetical protein
VLVPRVAAQTKKHNGPMGQVHVEREALAFYLFNHLFWLVRQKRAELEILPSNELELAQTYDLVGSKIAKRLFYYTLLIISREARHMYSSSGSSSAAYAGLNPEFVDFHKSLSSAGSGGVVEKFQNKPPMVTLGDYVTGMAQIFYKGGFGSGYGGKKWGDIAECLRKLVYGETTFEMFADTAFTLGHNGGPMFDKGMFYNGVDRALLYKILDVQRSGQIPELIREKGVSHVTSELSASVKEYVEEYPTDLGTYVDWFRVRAAGSLFDYPKEKADQVAKHGPSKISQQEAKKLASRFYLMPEVFVTKYDRKVAA